MEMIVKALADSFKAGVEFGMQSSKSLERPDAIEEFDRRTSGRKSFVNGYDERMESFVAGALIGSPVVQPSGEAGGDRGGVAVSFQIKQSDLTAIANPGGGRIESVEASTVGLKPGQVPKRIIVVSESAGGAALGRFFTYKQTERDAEGDAYSFQYEQDRGDDLLVIWND